MSDKGLLREAFVFRLVELVPDRGVEHEGL